MKIIPIRPSRALQNAPTSFSPVPWLGVEDTWALKIQTLVSPDVFQGVPSLVTLSVRLVNVIPESVNFSTINTEETRLPKGALKRPHLCPWGESSFCLTCPSELGSGLRGLAEKRSVGE